MTLLASAVHELSGILDSLRVSPIYRSSPRYVLDQPDFLNLVVGGDTDLAPDELLDATQAIEAAHGRDRSKERHKGPRTLDIDLVLYGDRVIRSGRLTVPHPGLTERAFVLVPLLDLAPDMVHPETGRPLRDYSRAVEGQGIYLHGDGRLYSGPSGRA